MASRRERTRPRVTSPEILEQIRALAASGEDLSYTGLVAAGRANLYAAGRQRFGSWPQTLALAGVPAELASRRFREQSWTAKKVIAAIIRRERRGHGLAFSETARDDKALVTAAVRLLGSWRAAVERAGFKYDEHRLRWDYDSAAGAAFEALVEQVFAAAGWEVTRRPRVPYPYADRKFLIPDFVLPGDNWWDAKLRANAPHVQETIERYLRVTSSLTIVFLSGTAVPGRARFVSIDELLEEVRDELDPETLKAFRERVARLRSMKVKITQLDEWALYWTRARVIEEIQATADRGESLLADDVRGSNPRLYGAVTRKEYFPSWYDAVTMAGFDGAALAAEGRKNRIAKRTLYPKEWCIERLLDLEKQGADLSDTALLESDPSLATALCRHYGSTASGLVAAGIDPECHRRQNRWSRQRVVRELQRLAIAGQSIQPSRLSEEDSLLYQAARRHFGTLERAIIEAGLQPAGRRHAAPWFVDGEFSLEAFGQTVQRHAAGGGGLTSQAVRQSAPELFGAAWRNIGGWYLALERLGFPVAEIRKLGRVATRKWSRDRIIEEIQSLVKNGESVAYSDVREAGRIPLLGAAEIYFENWSAALRAAGYDPNEHRRRRTRKWTPEIILGEICRLRAAAEDLSVTGAQNNHRQLYASAVALFGSWAAALRQAGIDPDEVRRGPPKWTDEAISTELRRSAGPARSITPAKLKREQPQLYDAIFRRYRKLEDAARNAGVSVTRKRKRWTAETIVTEIRRLQRMGVPLWSHAVRTSHPALFASAVAKKHYGSWEAAIEAAGINYAEIKRR